MEKSNNYCSVFDVYGIDVTLSVNNKKKIQTNFGAFLTISTLILLIIHLNDKITDMLDIKYSLISYSEEENKNKISLEFPIAISVSNQNGNKKHDFYRYFNIEAYYTNISRSFTGNEIQINEDNLELKVEKCSNQGKVNDYLDYYFNNSICIFSSNEFGGSKYSNLMSYISIVISRCNAINNLTCANDKEFNELFNSEIYINLDYNNFNDLNNNSFRINRLDFDKILIEKGRRNRKEYYISESQTYIKKGYISQYRLKSKYLFIDSKSTFSTDNTNDHPNLIEINLYSSNIIRKHYVKYITIMDILESVGGFLFLISLIMKLIINVVYSNLQKEILLKHLFNSELEAINKCDLNAKDNIIIKGSLNNAIIKNNRKGTNIINFRSKYNTFITNINLPKDNNSSAFCNLNKSDLDQIQANIDPIVIENKIESYNSILILRNEAKENKKTSFKLNFYNNTWFNTFERLLLKFCFCLSNKKLKYKNKIFTILKDKTADLFDLTHILTTLFDFHKLKYISLNDNQISLFNHLSSNNIYFLDKFSSNFNNLAPTSTRIRQIIEEINKNIHITMIDKRLIELVNKIELL